LQTFLTSLVAITDFNVSAVSLSTHGDGCTKCNFKSYKGRLLVAEIFTLDTQAQLMITQQKSALEIEQYLVSQGQQSLWTFTLFTLAVSLVLPMLVINPVANTAANANPIKILGKLILLPLFLHY
jgi:hypothetical protein